MNVDLIFKIAAIGILVVKEIAALFTLVKNLFGL